MDQGVALKSESRDPRPAVPVKRERPRRLAFGAGTRATSLLGGILWAIVLPNSALPAERTTEVGSARGHEVVAAFRERFREVDSSLASDLSQLYREDVQFRDPIAEIRGLDDLRRYFAHFAEQAEGARFEVRESIVGQDQAAVFWTLEFSDPDSRGEALAGISHLRFDERIYEQRDYFDLDAAVYRRIPVLNHILGWVRGRLAPRGIGAKGER